MLEQRSPRHDNSRRPPASGRDVPSLGAASKLLVEPTGALVRRRRWENRIPIAGTTASASSSRAVTSDLSQVSQWLRGALIGPPVMLAQR